MVAVKYNRPATLSLRYVGGRFDLIELHPGVNLNFPDSELKPLRNHPVWRAMLEVGEVEILRAEPTAEGEKEGFQVVEDKKTGQPMPIQDASVDAPIVQGQPQKPETKAQVIIDDGLTNINTATRDALIELPGIGAVTAARLMESRPFSDLESAKTASELSEVAWKKVEPLIVAE